MQPVNWVPAWSDWTILHITCMHHDLLRALKKFPPSSVSSVFPVLSSSMMIVWLSQGSGYPFRSMVQSLRVVTELRHEDSRSQPSILLNLDFQAKGSIRLFKGFSRIRAFVFPWTNYAYWDVRCDALKTHRPFRLQGSIGWPFPCLSPTRLSRWFASYVTIQSDQV